MHKPFICRTEHGQEPPMPPGSVPHPGGMRDNSPMFQHWEEPGKWRSSPEGTAEGARAVSAVPSGLDDLGTDQPNVETLGYCRMSLRDRVFVDYNQEKDSHGLE